MVARYDGRQPPRVGRVVDTATHRFAMHERPTELATVDWARQPGSPRSVQQLDVRSLRPATVEETIAAGLM